MQGWGGNDDSNEITETQAPGGMTVAISHGDVEELGTNVDEHRGHSSSDSSTQARKTNDWEVRLSNLNELLAAGF